MPPRSHYRDAGIRIRRIDLTVYPDILAFTERQAEAITETLFGAFTDWGVFFTAPRPDCGSHAEKIPLILLE